MKRTLTEYRNKRDFNRTSEPAGDEGAPGGGRSFVVQKHAATRLHWDFRLEWNGVLLSWAVTRGPSAAVSAKRLAVRTEDHPLDYATFEGTIPKPEYGAGTVMLWDRGTWAPQGDVDEGLAAGMLKFVLSGERMKGAWVLVRMKPRGTEKRENWLLIKEHDAHEVEDEEALVTAHMTSVATGRTMDEIAGGKTPKAAKPPAAKAKPPPPFHGVQLATLSTTVPLGDSWLHEVKVDGYRCLAAVGGGRVRLNTRSGLDWTTQFGVLVPAFERLPCDTALIDGEVVAAGVEVNAFSALQNRLKGGGALSFVAFDLLHLDGRDMTKLPLIDRKTALERLLDGCDGAIIYSTHLQGNGAEAFARVCAAGREGLVCKLANAPYRAGRNASWLKLKCGKRQEFVIGGWSPSAAKGRPFASLLMGTFQDGQLVYRGRVGSGFGDREFEELGPLLTRLERKTPPFAPPLPEERHVRWVAPELVAEVKFTELTADGHIRHGTFQGLRRDKPAQEIGLEGADMDTKPAKKGQSIMVKGVTITHPDRKIIDSPPVTKLDVAEHYAALADRMLPFLRNRPVSLLRCPDGAAGACFFQKHRSVGMADAIGTVSVSEDAEDANYITIAAAPGLIAAAQMGVVEFHIWGARNAALNLPDRIVFDLDPDEGLDFAAVRRAAFDLRDRLAAMKLPSVAMLSGGKGIHVIVPLRPKAEWETVKLFSRTMAVMLATAEPDRFVATMSKAKRKGLIFIDWLRNERGSTAVAPYSLRARPGAGVATPVTWDELADIASAGAFDIASVRRRLEQPCPLQEGTRGAVALGASVLTALDKMVSR